ncbi:hypothetical protein F0H08_06885 [Campylobacter jejuni]|uniref:YopX protein domain-containing protein n=3 Tax=Campylobacter jejuni TaxID=197 RepID=A0A5Y9K848_CAMJU|nr:YopX family protein [Campylobacter jejuni]ECQ6885975.1 hypothetical protein [Campylobacter coli]EAI4883558.1 hypothetical protein [Campylobacter jejuni]EAJ5894240.1 hypothetical protein [Campylobacter jejuni]EAJ8127912.1 hypothetical protein [Campylobacter jejuni]EAJ8388519.1 hypothetical protein [Campylobacter jejuni]
MEKNIKELKMKLKDFGFRIWDGKKYLKQKIYNDNINNNEYIAVTGNVNDENYVFTIEHGCERDYYGGDYDEYCKVKDFTSCNYEIELFIGLCDTNGKKIYEGDIAKIITFSYDFVGHVAYDKEETRFKLIDNKYMEDFANYEDWDSIEVIGNIHENKELLNVRL